VLVVPEATPRKFGSALASAIVLIGANVRPMPMPASTNAITRSE
jgi:hypothetical protein